MLWLEFFVFRIKTKNVYYIPEKLIYIKYICHTKIIKSVINIADRGKNLYLQISNIHSIRIE